MEPEKKDRRVRRTRQLLQSALLALLQEKRYEDISVQDIIERADVARSTFYVHYVDKDDLLVGGQGIFASNLGQHSEAAPHIELKSSSVFPTYLWFVHIKAQSHILKIIEKDSAMDLAMKTLQGIIRQSVQEKAWQHIQKDTNTVVPVSLIVDYLAGSLMVLLRWWWKEGMPYPPERMDEIFQQMVMPGVASML
jgi:AcrR family transcriptional regulator